MTIFRKRAASFSRVTALALLALFLTACNLAQIVQVINAGVLIAQEAAAITGVNIPPSYFTYVESAATCIGFAATENASSDSGAVKADKIFTACADAAKVNLPPGTAANAIAMAERLETAVKNILAKLPPGTKAAATAKPGVTEETLTDRDKAALNGLAVKASTVSAKAHSRKRFGCRMVSK